MKIYTTSGLGINVATKYYKHFNTKTRWVYDKKALLNQVDKWKSQIPWIKPYYAVKSNPLPYILKDLTSYASFNVGLDVASIQETISALDFTTLENTIYTNPHTIPHELEELKKTNSFNLKVVDSLCELELLNANNVKCPILIRMNSCVNTAAINFNSKFGASVEEAYDIIKFAKEYKYSVKGISFHIGSGGEYSRKESYLHAYFYAKPILNQIQATFYEEKPILNFGGGLLHDTDLKEALGWTESLPYQMIAEPGRYFSEPSHHMAMQVIAITPRGIFLDNGVYHELNCFHRDHWTMPKLTHFVDNGEVNKIEEYKLSTVFGPTCDSYDTIGEYDAPVNIKMGDWILLSNMGAYTNAGMIEFNGIKGASSLT
jgi:ornithine decarboxylase